MAIFHFNITAIQRSQGRSVVQLASSRAAESLYNQRLDKKYKVRKPSEVVYKEIFLPTGAPKWMTDREELWNAIEKREKRKDSQLAKEIRLALPKEFTLDQNIKLVQEFVKKEFVSLDILVDTFIHIKRRHGKDDEENEIFSYAYLLFSVRSISEKGFGLKVQKWDKKEQLLIWRETWSKILNKYLAKNGFDMRVDHRSYKEQGIDLEPQNQRGPKGTEKRFVYKVQEHHEIARENGERIYCDPCIALKALSKKQKIFTKKDLVQFIKGHSTEEQFNRVFGQVYSASELIHLKPEKGENQDEIFFTYRPHRSRDNSSLFSSQSQIKQKKE